MMKEEQRKMSKPFKGVFRRAKPAVNIQRDFYTMATVDGDEAEIIMYGEIVEERPRDWWTDEPLEGNYIVLDEFLEDLKQVSDVSKITIRLNSVGGDAYAAIPIHNRLRELKAKKTVIVDGVAMSGGSLIMCAAETVKVNASSLIMIHKCWCRIWGGFNADELRKLAASNDAVDKAQAAIYKRKTGMSEEDILTMMADETYMTGTEAVEKGFADELMEGDAPNIAASADLSTLYVNGRALRLSNPLSKLPESIPTVKSDDTSVKTNKNMPAKTGGQEGGKTMAKNLEELRAENPELAEQIMAEAQAAASQDAGTVSAAVEAERKRIAEIDEIAALYDDETVREAKYGENPCTAQEMAFAAAKKAAKQGQKFMGELNDDFKASGAEDVDATPAAEEDDKPLTPEQRMAQGRADAKKIQKKEDK
jgi:ATP-dependent protease ClpP protease subunit